MMKRLQHWIRNIFGFSRAETNGLLILLPLMLIVIFSQPIYRLMTKDQPLNFDKNQAKIDSLVANWDFNPVDNIDAILLFPFDPNVCSKEDFDSLGFPSFLSNRIINYRSKGGRFSNAEDLLKIYGMDTSFYERLHPFVIIQAKPSVREYANQKQVPKYVKEEIESFDLNDADTSQLKLIRGIGTVLAARIVKYREALGGFDNLLQLKEVYGLDTAVVREVINKSFISPDFKPRQLNINKVTERDFSRHPYIEFKMAKSIIAYRFQHGSFIEIDDLLKIDLIDQQKFDKIRPYLKVEP